jgi:hypothetical protein
MSDAAAFATQDPAADGLHGPTGWTWVVAVALVLVLLLGIAPPASAASATSGVVTYYIQEVNPPTLFRCAAGVSSIANSNPGFATAIAITRSHSNVWCGSNYPIAQGNLRNTMYTLTRFTGSSTWVVCNALQPEMFNPSSNWILTHSRNNSVTHCRDRLASYTWHGVVIQGVNRTNGLPIASPDIPI